MEISRGRRGREREVEALEGAVGGAAGGDAGCCRRRRRSSCCSPRKWSCSCYLVHCIVN